MSSCHLPRQNHPYKTITNHKTTRLHKSQQFHGVKKAGRKQARFKEMATRAGSSTATLAAAVLVVAVFVGGAAAQSTDGCTQTLISMSPCLNYITGNETAPSKSCCSQLGTVVQSQPQCICVALNADPASLGLNINKTRALGLPELCNVKTPPVSDCKSAAAPTSPSSGTPAGQTPTSAGTGSKATPTTNVWNGGESLRGSAGLVAGFIVAVVYAASAA